MEQGITLLPVGLMIFFFSGFAAVCFRTGSPAGTSRRTVTTGSVSTTTDSVRTYLD